MRFRSAIPALCFLVLPLLSGCAVHQASQDIAHPVNALSGKVHRGQQPVSGITTQLYAVRTSGDGSAATPLLSQAVTTGGDGDFTITGQYYCSGASLVYLTATGGNPGMSSANGILTDMVALAPCSSLSAINTINITEVTTVAA